jgi:hypothetical protein
MVLQDYKKGCGVYRGDGRDQASWIILIFYKRLPGNKHLPWHWMGEDSFLHGPEIESNEKKFELPVQQKSGLRTKAYDYLSGNNLNISGSRTLAVVWTVRGRND